MKSVHVIVVKNIRSVAGCKMKTKKCTYKATGTAREFLLNKPKTGLSYIKRKLENGHDWIYIYQGQKQIWDCNPEFFRTWFIRE